MYEESAFVLVDVNAVKLREKLSLQLWDSDRMSVVSLLVSPPMRALMPPAPRMICSAFTRLTSSS